MTILAATGDNTDPNRKPNLAMWDYFKENLNGDLNIDTRKSFYCGDAAGR